MSRADSSAAQRGSSLDSPPMEFFVRPGSSWSGASQTVEASPCYVLEWNEEHCAHRFLNSVDELRAHVDAGKSDRVQRLFVIHGLPDGYVKALRSSLDIDPAFIEAHAGRRRYRPLRWRRDAKFAHYEYPELVSGLDKAVLTHFFEAVSLQGSSSIDLLGDPLVRAVSDLEDLAAVFCHASLWITDRADVLFLDRPVWRDAASPLRKARRSASVTKPYQMRPWSSDGKKPSWDVRLADGDEIASLEDVLQETLKDAAEIGDELISMIAELAYDQWLELFQVLTPHQQPKVQDGASLYWQITRSLEQNYDVGKYIGRHRFQVGDAYPDWFALLLRTQRRIELLPTILPKPLISRKPTKVWDKKISRRNTLNSTARVSKQSNQSSDDNQRSLDRVTYLGGFLLPFSIVSGVLSMNADYEPGSSRFWVFWALSSPLAILAILVIYADTLRKAEVWVEVATEGVVATVAPQLSTEPAQVEEEKDRPPGQVSTERYGARLQSHGRFQNIVAESPEVVTYSAGEDVIIDIEAPTAEATEEALEEVLEGEEEEEEPTMILERSSNGSTPRAWKKQQLGWYGACKVILGLKKPRQAKDIPLGLPAWDKQTKRKTQTY